MVDNPKSFIIIILAFVLSLTLIINTTRSFLRESEQNSTFTISVNKETATKNAASKTTVKSATPKSNQLVLTPAPLSKTDFAVYLTQNSFSPTNLTIKSGQSIRFINDSSSSMLVTTPPSPNNTSLSELNQNKSVGRGGYYDFTFNRKGSFLYYNNNDRTKTGVIIVE
ncbi:MAG: hypothetical protein Q7S34_02675 [bacterium]|nr:hypothetical protein [bacterium]